MEPSLGRVRRSHWTHALDRSGADRRLAGRQGSHQQHAPAGTGRSPRRSGHLVQ
jgi:hypothetical protein